MAASTKEINVFQFLQRFGTQELCEAHIREARWPGGIIICPYCGHNRAYNIEGGKRFKCANNKCYKKFSSKVGTFLEDTNLKLPVWFLLIYLMASNRKSISSFQIARNLGISQKSSWYLMHKLRLVFEEKYIEPVSGTVEVDECFLGKGAWSRWGSISTRKTPILGIIQRGGRVIIKTIEDRNQATLNKMVLQYVVPGSTVYTDGWLGYNRLKKHYKHDAVNHSNHEYVRGDVHTNNIEGVWAFFKKNIRNGHHSISGKHVQRYCNEVAWKFNNRHLSTMERFDEMLKRCLQSQHLIIEFKKVRGLRAA